MRYLLIILLCLVNRLLCFSQTNKASVVQFDNCESIRHINFDNIRAGMPDDLSITMILLRAESSHHDGTYTITPIDSLLGSFDTSLIHIFSFELKYTKGANSCEFNFTLNGQPGNATKGIPPFLCITTADTILLKYIKDQFNLTYYSKNNKYLLLSGIYNTDKDFFQQLNRIISRYTPFFLLNYLNTRSKIGLHQKTIKQKVEDQLGFNIGFGTFMQQLKKSEYVHIPPNQSFKSTALSMNISGVYKHYLTDHTFVKAGLDLLFFSSEVYSKSISSFPIAPGYSVIPKNPIATSNALKAGFSLSGGYRFDKLPLAGKIKALNLDAGLFVGKIITGTGKAQFSVRQSDGKVIPINNISVFRDQYTFCFISNPNLELSLSESSALQLGLSGMWGFSKMNSISTYKLVNSNGEYNALENASDKIFLQSIGFTAGIIYNLK